MVVHHRRSSAFLVAFSILVITGQSATASADVLKHFLRGDESRDGSKVMHQHEPKQDPPMSSTATPEYGLGTSDSSDSGGIAIDPETLLIKKSTAPSAPGENSAKLESGKPSRSSTGKVKDLKKHRHEKKQPSNASQSKPLRPEAKP
jgi:hypothetical protein